MRSDTQSPNAVELHVECCCRWCWVCSLGIAILCPQEAGPCPSCTPALLGLFVVEVAASIQPSSAQFSRRNLGSSRGCFVFAAIYAYDCEALCISVRQGPNDLAKSASFHFSYEHSGNGSASCFAPVLHPDFLPLHCYVMHLSTRIARGLLCSLASLY